jgi:signal peptidase I
VPRRLGDRTLRVLARAPGLYSVLAFLTARRVIVRGHSMYPLLVPGERVLFDRLAYHVGRPVRGEVVLAGHPARPGRLIVKRVAATPGDEVAVQGDRCWVNGKPAVGVGGEGDAPPAGEVLGSGEYFLLGDAADFSTDGRKLGPVRGRDLRGRAWMVYWPLSRVRWLRGK